MYNGHFIYREYADRLIYFYNACTYRNQSWRWMEIMRPVQPRNYQVLCRSIH